MGAGASAPVGVAVVGDATLFAHYGFHVVRRVVEAIAGTTVYLHITSLDEMRVGFAERSGNSVVITSDFPDADCARLLCASDLPLIAFVDDPSDTLNWIISSRSPNFIDATRFATRVFSAIALPLTTQRTLLIDGASDHSPEAIVAAIINHVFPGRGEEFTTATFDYLVKSKQISREVVVDRSEYRKPDTGVISATDAELLAEMRNVVECYSDLLLGRLPEQFFWPLDLFIRLDNRPPRAPFELTGPARVLLFGPYLHLPVGDWVVRFEFEIDGAISSVEATTDVYINEVVIEKMFMMPARGIYAYELSFRVEDPHVPIQLRLFTKTSAIEGIFLPRSVRIRSGQRKALG
jgi:hypothetical protein